MEGVLHSKTIRVCEALHHEATYHDSSNDRCWSNKWRIQGVQWAALCEKEEGNPTCS